jgi:hypothetical protein
MRSDRGCPGVWGQPAVNRLGKGTKIDSLRIYWSGVAKVGLAVD